MLPSSAIFNKQRGVWLALYKEKREIIGDCIDKPSRESAKERWRSLPAMYQ